MKSIILFYILFSSLLTQAQNCEDLIAYRDVQLKNDFDKAFSNYSTNSSAKEQMLKLKTDLFDETYWHTTDAARMVSHCLNIIKLQCDLTRNIISFAPPIAAESQAISYFGMKANAIYEWIKKGEFYVEIAQSLEYTAYKEALASAGPVGKTINLVSDLTKSLKDISEIDNDHSKLRAEVSRIESMLENSISKYEENITNNKIKLKSINETIIAITKWLNENCKNHKINTTTKKTGSKQLNEKERITKISQGDNEKVASNSIYVFFTINNIYKNGKFITLVSPPILHEGKLTDNFYIEKADFVENVIKQFTNGSNDFEDNLKKDNYKSISVIGYAAPYENRLIKSKADCIKAIETWKDFMNKSTEGQLGADQMEFFQINNL